MTSVGLYFMAGLGQWTVRGWWGRGSGIWDFTAQDLISLTPGGYRAQACNEGL